jgi:putative oxidoreductase
MNSTFTTILRMLLGISLLIFGMNKFIAFIPLFDIKQAAAANFMESLNSTGYVLYVVASLELLIGGLLLFKKWVPFALILLAPIVVNILLFHLFLDVSGMFVAVFMLTITGVLIYKYWKSYTSLFQ